jgi:hypothetical protein
MKFTYKSQEEIDKMTATEADAYKVEQRNLKLKQTRCYWVSRKKELTTQCCRIGILKLQV